MNLLASGWNRAYKSGMLLMEVQDVDQGVVTKQMQRKNLVVGKDKLPDAYDEYSYPSGQFVHYEFRYTRL